MCDKVSIALGTLLVVVYNPEKLKVNCLFVFGKQLHFECVEGTHYLKLPFRDFLGGLGPATLYRGPRFHPWSDN